MKIEKLGGSMVNAVSYLRVSGESQIAGDGFPRQREKIAAYAEKNSITLVEEFRDEGVTGKMELEGREGLSACLAYVRENHINLVLIEDATRLARDMIIAEVVIRQFQQLGVRVVSASGGIDLTEGDDSNPTAKLIRQILAAVSEFERCCITLKLKGARDRKRKATGRCEGSKPFGTKEGEDLTLQQIHTLRAAGWSYDRVAEALNENSHPTRKGGPWCGSTVHKILKRES